MTTQFNKFFSAILFAALAFFTSDSFSRATITQLPSDPALVTGQLDNGMKYIVMKHSNPDGQLTPTNGESCPSNLMMYVD